MIVLLGLILVSVVDCGTFLRDLSQSSVYLPTQNLIVSSGITDNTYDNYNSYINSREDDERTNEFDILSQEERIFSNKWDTLHRFVTDKDKELIQTYILVRTVRQRNKRYVNYLTLCHFKICNIGKRRVPRFPRHARIAGENDI